VVDIESPPSSSTCQKIFMMRKMKILFALLYLVNGTFGVITNQYLSTVKVAIARFAFPIKSEKLILYHDSKKLAASQCSKLDWCILVCKEKENTYILSEIIAAPFEVDDYDSDTYTCYTTRPRNNIMISSGEVTVERDSGNFSAIDLRVSSNLLKGIFGFNNKDCYASQMVEKPYILFDLGSSKSVRKVSVASERSSWATDYFRYLKVKISDELLTGNAFGPYQLMGYYNAVAPGADTVFETTNTSPMTGRYIVIQVLQSTPLVICNVQIYV